MSAQITPKDADMQIEILIDEYGDDVLKICYTYLPNKEMVEDAFQETFIKIYKNIEKFKGDSSKKTWIIRITINTCKDFLKTSWVKRVLFLDDSVREGSYTIEEDIIRDINNGYISKIIKALPKKYKDILILYYYHGYSIKEIEEILKIKEYTIKNRLFRGRNMIKCKLEEEEWFNYENRG